MCVFESGEESAGEVATNYHTLTMFGMNGGIASRLAEWVPAEPSVLKCTA